MPLSWVQHWSSGSRDSYFLHECQPLSRGFSEQRNAWCSETKTRRLCKLWTDEIVLQSATIWIWGVRSSGLFRADIPLNHGRLVTRSSHSKEKGWFWDRSFAWKIWRRHGGRKVVASIICDPVKKVAQYLICPSSGHIYNLYLQDHYAWLPQITGSWGRSSGKSVVAWWRDAE